MDVNGLQAIYGGGGRRFIFNEFPLLVLTLAVCRTDAERWGKKDRSKEMLMWAVLHAADISAQAKPDPLFIKWSDRCYQVAPSRIPNSQVCHVAPKEGTGWD